MRINLTNDTTKNFKQVKLGFSWTTFFFGFWPSLFRGDWKWFFIMLGVNIILWIVDAATAGMASLINLAYNIGMGVFYNKFYIKDLIAKGYKPADSASRDALLAKDIEIKNF